MESDNSGLTTEDGIVRADTLLYECVVREPNVWYKVGLAIWPVEFTMKIGLLAIYNTVEYE